MRAGHQATGLRWARPERNAFGLLPALMRTRILSTQPHFRERHSDRMRERLEHWPEMSGAKPLREDLAGWYRLRTGDYRLRFRVQGETIIVDKIGHRREFYED